MLQQTQVKRVIERYPVFIREFPGFAALARAPLRRILAAWSGLGYNRRSLALKRSAEIIVRSYRGRLPRTLAELVALPGVGHATACAVLAYAFNEPVAFIETNIRTVYIHHFFRDQGKVSDQDILRLVEATADRRNPRQWYWALMDYGTHIKKRYGNPGRKSAHYVQQPPFGGSHRQVRGRVLATLAKRACSVRELGQGLQMPLRPIQEAVNELQQEGFIAAGRGRYRIA